jgi:hypothetical protein
MEHIDDLEDDAKNPAGVLRLSLISGSGSNLGREYVSFTGSNQELVGSISGHEASVMGIAQSGVKLESAGADYAEYLPRLNENESIKPGDVVGVFSGKISKKTDGADKVMVVSTMPLVLGNWKGKESEKLYHAVAFVGQVPARVSGKVRAGDFIIPSGKHDGKAIAVSKEKLTVDQLSQLIGQAWSSSEVTADKDINVAITGMDRPSDLLRSLQAENAKMKEDLESLRKDVSAIKAALKK